MKAARGPRAPHTQPTMSRKESALDLAKFIDKGVRVKLAGGREGEEDEGGRRREPHHPSSFSARAAQAPSTITPTISNTNTVAGVLKGYDQLLNLVLDEAREYLRGET